MPHGGVEKCMYRAKSPAGKDEFHTHELMAFLHVAQELNLTLGARGKVRVPALRTCNHIAIPIPEQDGLAQPGPCCNERLRRLRRGHPPIQYGDFRWFHERQAVTGRFQVIQQDDMVCAQLNDLEATGYS